MPFVLAGVYGPWCPLWLNTTRTTKDTKLHKGLLRGVGCAALLNAVQGSP